MSTDFDRDLPRVLVDPIQIQQVCLNLIRNAIDAMSEQPAARRRLAFATRCTGAKVVVRCTDSGPGVAPDMRERLFQPFQTNKREGMGMGLSISASIAAAHGGALRYAADMGEGACFELMLPAILE